MSSGNGRIVILFNFWSQRVHRARLLTSSANSMSQSLIKPFALSLSSLLPFQSAVPNNDMAHFFIEWPSFNASEGEANELVSGLKPATLRTLVASCEKWAGFKAPLICLRSWCYINLFTYVLTFHDLLLLVLADDLLHELYCAHGLVDQDHGNVLHSVYEQTSIKGSLTATL